MSCECGQGNARQIHPATRDGHKNQRHNSSNSLQQTTTLRTAKKKKTTMDGRTDGLNYCALGPLCPLSADRIIGSLDSDLQGTTTAEQKKNTTTCGREGGRNSFFGPLLWWDIIFGFSFQLAKRALIANAPQSIARPCSQI